MAVIGEKAPNLKLGKWVQGMDTNFDKEGDNVNCLLYTSDAADE